MHSGPLGHHRPHYNMSKDTGSWPWLSLQETAVAEELNISRADRRPQHSPADR